MRVECEVTPRHLTIVECRPPWQPMPNEEWTRMPIARLRYTQTTTQWSLFWADRHSRFRGYSRLPSAGTVTALLNEIDADPLCVFWG
jgi:hypothetical protein